MKELNYDAFIKSAVSARPRAPLFGQIELTYKCPLGCIHCYCSGQENRELSPAFWKDVISQARKAGGIEITFTGGDPLLYPGFREVYEHAVKNGFLINLFISGFYLSREILGCLTEHPPLNIEITLNSLKKSNYERIAGRKNSFEAVMTNIGRIKSSFLPLVIKCNGLKENKDEILDIKRFTENLLGKGHFKFDSFIFPGLNGDSRPVSHRLEPEEILEIEASDADMASQRGGESSRTPGWFNPGGLYHCNSWNNRYFINPAGILQFCHLTMENSTDLTGKKLIEGFERFPDILKKKYTKESKCINCGLKEFCLKCPARAFLETGDPESPVEYYCRMARMRKDGMGIKI